MLVKGKTAALRPFSEIALDCRTLGFLLFPKSRQLVLGAEARISKALGDKLLCDNMINLGSVALLIGTVVAFFFAETDNTLVNRHAESVQSLDDFGNAVDDFTLFVGVLNS